MSRPRYETQSDRHNEQNVIFRWDSKFNCESKKLPDHYYVDYCCTRTVDNSSEIVALAEVKRRNLHYGQIDIIEVGAKKRMEALRLGEYLDVPAYMIYLLHDGIYYLDFKTKPIRHKWGGRMYTARDSQDQEPMVIWDKMDLKKL